MTRVIGARQDLKDNSKNGDAERTVPLFKAKEENMADSHHYYFSYPRELGCIDGRYSLGAFYLLIFLNVYSRNICLLS